MDALPSFRYHPDPVATGSVVASAGTCRCCGRARGYLYVGPVVADEALDEALDDALCPWCIADGSAHARFGAEFTDEAGIGGGIWPDAPAAARDAVGHRTPGFSGWQQERWAVCCGDAAAYLGTAGRAEIVARYPDAVADLRREAALVDTEWEPWFAALDAAGSPVAYIFRCLHCGRHTGYTDGH